MFNSMLDLYADESEVLEKCFGNQSIVQLLDVDLMWLVLF